MDNLRLLDIQSFTDFDSAAREVLNFLHQRLGFDLWMVTRTEGADWIVLQVNDHGYGVKEGTVLRWADSFCSRMVAGYGPRIAPCSDAIPAYASAPIGRQVPIGSYVGVPLTYHGALFGTLCAIHPTAQSELITAELPLIELVARLLSTLLSAELKVAEQTRYAERAQAEAMTDSLTGLYNRRGWDYLLTFEEKRCEQYGHPACVISLDLDGLKHVNDTYGHAQGDTLIRQAAQALKSSVRKQDIVARLGGDEFAVLGVECSAADGAGLVERIQQSLMTIRVDASLGLASHHPGEGLFQTYQTADEAMYCCKRSRAAANPKPIAQQTPRFSFASTLKKLWSFPYRSR